MADKVAVLIPCYNEAVTIGKVVDDFKRVLPDADVYVYDNNSKDGTADIAREHGAIVKFEGRQGKGNVVRSMFRDIDADTVDFVDNYDGSMQEPVLLPTTFPNVLVSANMGIAVGMASNICSFNLAEVCRTTIALIKNPDADLLDTLPAPDFPTGGEILYDPAQML